MSQFTVADTKGFANNAALGNHLRVKMTSGYLALAGANDQHIGTMDGASLAADTTATVFLRCAGGTRKMVAAGAISADADVFGAASGKVNDVTSGVYVGRAVTAASADGDVIEVQEIPFTPLPLMAAQQALSGAGAVNVTTYYTAWTTTGADAGTLADGAYLGQMKKVQLIVDGGDGTLTPTTFVNGTTITFADAGDYALLVWGPTGWTAIEVGNDTDGATAPVIA